MQLRQRIICISEWNGKHTFGNRESYAYSFAPMGDKLLAKDIRPFYNRT